MAWMTHIILKGHFRSCIEQCDRYRLFSKKTCVPKRAPLSARFMIWVAPRVQQKMHEFEIIEIDSSV
jgi:hypothetical protein